MNQDSQTIPHKPLIGVELVIDAARQHGEDSEPDHEVGDLQDALRSMWGILTPGQKLVFMGLDETRERCIDNLGHLPGFHDDLFEEKFDELADELAGESVEPGDLHSELMLAFPGFASDTEVDGGDLVEWVGQHLEDLQRICSAHVEHNRELDEAAGIVPRATADRGR